MDKSISEAIKLRCKFLQFMRANMRINPNITGFEFTYTLNCEKKEFEMWSEWREFTDKFETAFSKTEQAKIPLLIEDAKKALAFLLERSLVTALSEIIVSDFNVKIIQIKTDGFHLVNNKLYHLKNENRYKFPETVTKVLQDKKYGPLITQDLICKTMAEFAIENSESGKISFLFNGRIPEVHINISNL